MKYILIILIIFTSSKGLSQVIYEGNYSNTSKTYKDINEPKGNKTFVQLTLNENGDYTFSGYIYNRKNKTKECFKHNGKWFILDDILTLNKEGSGDYGRIIKYKMNRKNLFYIGSNDTYNKNIRLRIVKNKKVFNCE